MRQFCIGKMSPKIMPNGSPLTNKEEIRKKLPEKIPCVVVFQQCSAMAFALLPPPSPSFLASSTIFFPLPHLLFLLLFLPHPSMAVLSPNDFQLFTAIFFVLLAVGLVLSVAFACALYFFYWYGRRKKAEEDGYHRNNGGEARPIQWITTTYRDQEQPAVWTTKETPQMYSPNGWHQPYYGQKPSGPTLRDRLAEWFGNLVESTRNGCQRLVSMLSRRRHPPPPHSPTIFPAEAPVLSPPPSYISAQSGEAFANWSSPPPRPPPPPPKERKPKGILKKPKRWTTNGRGGPTMMPRGGGGPIVVPVQRGGAGDIGRRPPPIRQQWRWHPKLEEGPSQRVVEDRVEREESCVKGRLVAVERRLRTTTTTTAMMAGEKGGQRAPQHWPKVHTFV